ncbi:hypothetical protein ACLB2K_073412 [Fragaria x ananassa]
MDVLGVNNRSPKQSKRSSRSSKGVKVVYISSPMKVQTSASKFRALVQELTGRDSDAERFMETNGGDGHHHHHKVPEFSHEKQLKEADRDHHKNAMIGGAVTGAVTNDRATFKINSRSSFFQVEETDTG